MSVAHRDYFTNIKFNFRYICATKVDKKNVMKKFGYCNDVCLKQMCFTEEDKKCIFPFK